MTTTRLHISVFYEAAKTWRSTIRR